MGAHDATLQGLQKSLVTDAKASSLAWKSRTGGKIVGVIGADVPFEIILGAGMLPVRLCATLKVDTGAADHFGERGDSNIIQNLAGMLLGDDLDWLDIVVIGNTPIHHVPLFLFLREFKRLNPDARAPELLLFEQFHGGSEHQRNYNLEACRRLSNALQSLGGDLDDTSLRAAITKMNKRRQELREMDDQRRSQPAKVTGTEALFVIMSAYMMVEEPVRTCLLAECRSPRLLFSGSDTGHLESYAAIEAAGCTIVSDDHDFGSQEIAVDVGKGAPMEMVASALGQKAPRCARSPTSARISALKQQIQDSGADGVILWINEEDHCASWDRPELEKALNELKVPLLDLGLQELTISQPQVVTEKVSAWLAESGLRVKVGERV